MFLKYTLYLLLAGKTASHNHATLLQLCNANRVKLSLKFSFTTGLVIVLGRRQIKMIFKLLNYQLQVNVNRTVNCFFLPVLTTYPTCRSWRMQQQAQKRATVRAPRLPSRMGTLSRVSGTACLTRSASNGLIFLISFVTVILFMLHFLEILDSVICGFVCLYGYVRLHYRHSCRPLHIYAS